MKVSERGELKRAEVEGVNGEKRLRFPFHFHPGELILGDREDCLSLSPVFCPLPECEMQRRLGDAGLLPFLLLQTWWTAGAPLARDS